MYCELCIVNYAFFILPLHFLPNFLADPHSILLPQQRGNSITARGLRSKAAQGS